MTDRLVVGVLGNPNSGKSKTWYELFERSVRTGTHPKWLELRPGQWVEVFLISGSPEETGTPVEVTLRHQACPIVLCSMQYTERVHETLDYFINQGFVLYIQWLNPGYGGEEEVEEDRSITDKILSAQSAFSMRNGNAPPSGRVQEIKEFIYGWAKYRHPRFS